MAYNAAAEAYNLWSIPENNKNIVLNVIYFDPGVFEAQLSTAPRFIHKPTCKPPALNIELNIT